MFEQDKELIEEYHKAFSETKPKNEKSKEDQLKFLGLKEGETINVRVVQIPGQKSFLKESSHYRIMSLSNSSHSKDHHQYNPLPQNAPGMPSLANHRLLM